MPLATKIRRLIDLKRQPDGSEYPLAEIAREASRLYRTKKNLLVNDEGGEEEKDVLNRQFLSELLSGKRANPPFDKIEALSLFFEVSPAYFAIGAEVTEETRAAENEVQLIADLRELKEKLDTEGDEASEEGTELLAAIFRGAKEEDPQAVMGVFRMTLAAMKMNSRKDRSS
jgi:transcriptional regulator with XRE-family HTH domain